MNTDSDFAILVYDTSVNVDTHSIDYWFEEVQKHLENPNLLVIGNKTDMLA